MSNQSITSVSPANTYYASQSAGLPAVNPFQVLIQVISERVMALMGLMAEASGSMEQSTNAELEAQKMSNNTNSVLVNVENKNDASATGTLPNEVVDYINDNHIIIPGVNEGANGEFCSIVPVPTNSTDPAPAGTVYNTFNAGQLEAIKGEFDVEATTYADSSSQTQMTIQEVAQSFSMSISEISQLMAKSNQVATTIVNNLK